MTDENKKCGRNGCEGVIESYVGNPGLKDMSLRVQCSACNYGFEYQPDKENIEYFESDLGSEFMKVRIHLIGGYRDFIYKPFKRKINND